jgi:hypothetical protein
MHEGIKVLAFDVFGTMVDWHGTIAREVAARHPQVDGDKFALAWRCSASCPGSWAGRASTTCTA